jgi:YVTN family beta-propeller protein
LLGGEVLREMARLVRGAGLILILSYIGLSGGCAYEPECDQAPEGALKAPIGIAVRGTFLYITNSNVNLEYCSGFLAKVDLEDDFTINNIPAKFDGRYFSLLGEIAISGKYAYVTERSFHSLLKFDLEQEKVVGRVPVGEDPFGVSVKGEGPTTLVFVANMSSDDISVIDAISMEKIKQIPLGNGTRPTKIATFGDKLYVAQQYTSKISVIDLNSLETIDPIDWEGYCRGISSGSKNLYVSKRSPDILTVIAPEFSSVIDVIPLGSGPDGVAVNDDLILVANFGSDNAYILDAASNEIVAIVAVGNGPTEIAISGDYAYVVNYLSQNVSVIDTETLEVTGTIP